MYTDPNYKTKKALKDAVSGGKSILVFQPGPFAKPPADYTGEFAVEGPHYPAAHTWYARVRVESGIVKKVLS